MAIVRQIELFDNVELIEPVDAAPAGARGGPIHFLRDGDVAEVEIMEPDLGDLDRIVYVPLAKLRRVG
jgi:hypothetical protein